MSSTLRRPRRALSWLLLAAGGGLIVAAVSVFALFSVGLTGQETGSSGPGTVIGFGSVLSAGTPANAPAAASPVTAAPLDRLIIPSVDVDAPIVTKTLDANRVMQSPDNAYDVAWYDFTARPGEGSNAVFAGHVDYVNVGPAVFWPLKDLNPGDPIEIRYADGTAVSYQVSAVNTFDAATAPIDVIVGPTPVDSLTLITCAGAFNRSTRQYEQRLVVRAEKA